MKRVMTIITLILFAPFLTTFFILLFVKEGIVTTWKLAAVAVKGYYNELE